MLHASAACPPLFFCGVDLLRLDDVLHVRQGSVFDWMEETNARSPYVPGRICLVLKIWLLHSAIRILEP
jgi:hypothetical protein